jgi:hypothetical protein
MNRLLQKLRLIFRRKPPEPEICLTPFVLAFEEREQLLQVNKGKMANEWPDSHAERFVSYEQFFSCYNCKHRHEDSPLTCSAFPEFIPKIILTARNRHREPFPGDRGIQYEAKEQ